jgi:hypothetical protein
MQEAEQAHKHPSMALLLLAALLLISISASAEPPALDLKACAELGFKEPDCSTCGALTTFLPKEDAEELFEDCQKCCVRSQSRPNYTSASLIICPRSIG